MPLEVAPGMEVYGGAINLDGLLRIEITRTGEASTLGKVIGLMQQAERANRRSPACWSATPGGTCCWCC